jgi:hypothetical protein
MKTLELNQMEEISGDGCGLTLALAGAGLVLMAFQPWSYFVFGGITLSAIGVVGDCIGFE